MKIKKLIYTSFNNRIIKWVLLSFGLFYFQGAFAVSSLDENINSHQKEYERVALQIWDLAEVGYQEYKSSKLLKESLSKKGFKIKENVANIPTAFTAEYG